MTSSGHLILTDLGMSRVLHPGQRSMSYVGTPQYMVCQIKAIKDEIVTISLHVVPRDH